MLTFTNYLSEAKISSSRLEKVLFLYVRMIEKRIGYTLHRFGGPKGSIPIKNGTGYLFIASNGRAYRFNYVKGEIASITIWMSFRLGRNGDYTVDLDGIGIMQAGKRIIDLLANPKTGKHMMFANPELKENFLTEAKRIKPEDFYNLVNNNISAGSNISKMSWDEISNIASANGVLIPSVVRKMKQGKGKATTYDLMGLVSDKFTPAEEKATEKDYFIKITAQDKNTKSFVSVKGDKVAQQMLNTIKQTIDNPNPKEEAKNPNTLFGIMKNLVQLVCRKSRNSLLIYGGPGLGKTYTVVETIKEEGLVKNKDWFVVKGKITTVSLYQTLFMHRKGSVLVFDDTDSVWGDKEAANILKAALDSYDERMISWYSARTVNVSKMTDEEKEEFNDKVDDRLLSDAEGNVKLPSEFIYEGRIIFISNLTKDKFDSAVLTRSAKIDMTLTDSQIFMRIESILEHLGDKSVSIDVKKEILDFLRARNAAGLLEGPSMRTFVAAEDLYKSGLPNWRELLDYV